MRYIRKIFYLDLYNENTKVKNCGYVKMEAMPAKTYFYFYVNNISYQDDLELTAKISLQKGTLEFEHLKVKNHSICEVVMVPKNISEQNVQRIDMVLPGQRKLCYVKVQNQVVNHTEPVPVKPVVEEAKIVTANQKAEMEMTDDAQQEDTLPVAETKWEQLKSMFPVIQIFGKDTETMLFKPKDLIILPQQYHYLATNSFLLHGYYNYRQLLLTRWQVDEGEQYYIGVPGTFHDREKSVARMFGFEGFENGESSRRDTESKVYPGCFGYYMKKVTI